MSQILAETQLDQFLKMRLINNTKFASQIPQIEEKRKSGESFSQALVRLGFLKSDHLGVATLAAWGEVKLPLNYKLFVNSSPFGYDRKNSIDEIDELNTSILNDPALSNPKNNLESRIIHSTQHILLRPDHNFTNLTEKENSQPPVKFSNVPQPGMQIRHLRLLRRLDSGGSAEVWKAWHENLGMHVAIKFLRPHLNQSDFTPRFFQEARLIASLNHKNIIRVFNCDKLHGLLFIEAEYIMGNSLGALVRLGAKFSLRTTLKIIMAVAQGLAHAYRRGILHLDVKPDNIMATTEGEVKLMDFGLAQAIIERKSGEINTISESSMEKESPLNPKTSVEKFEEAAMIDEKTTMDSSLDMPEEESPKVYRLAGTPAFMAPELLNRALAPTIQADIYSLGVSLFLLASGQLPYKAKTVAQMFCQHLYTPIPSMEDLNPVLKIIDPVLKRTMAKSPTDRYSTYNELILDLHSILTSEIDPGSSNDSFIGDEIVSEELGEICRELS